LIEQTQKIHGIHKIFHPKTVREPTREEREKKETRDRERERERNNDVSRIK
jgi:hypothetical protein